MFENYPTLKAQNLSPDMLKRDFFNGVDGPALNTPAIYALFKRSGSGAFKIGKKWFWPTHLFIKWWESQAR